MKIKKIWLLIGTILFSVVGIIYFLNGDKAGAIVEFGVALLFLIGFIVQIVRGKKKQEQKTNEVVGK